MATPTTQGLSQGDFMKKCEVMNTGAQANPEPSAQGLVFAFAVALEGAKEALSRRALHRYLMQQASRDFEGFLATLNDLYSRMRRFYQAMFGSRAEKLAEFGLQPLRPAARAKPNPQSPEQTPPQQTPPEQVQSASQAAIPAADSTFHKEVNTA
jgi:hypothetical protein